MRYNGQEWTCARCHQLKKDCPGLAVARNCTADRVLLSEHMREHWEILSMRWMRKYQKFRWVVLKNKVFLFQIAP